VNKNKPHLKLKKKLALFGLRSGILGLDRRPHKAKNKTVDRTEVTQSDPIWYDLDLDLNTPRTVSWWPLFMHAQIWRNYIYELNFDLTSRVGGNNKWTSMVPHSPLGHVQPMELSFLSVTWPLFICSWKIFVRRWKIFPREGTDCRVYLPSVPYLLFFVFFFLLKNIIYINFLKRLYGMWWVQDKYLI